MKNVILKMLKWEPDSDFKRFFDFNMFFSVTLFKLELLLA